MVFNGRTACPSLDDETAKVHYYYETEQRSCKGVHIPLLEFALLFCLLAGLGCLFSYLQVFVVLLIIRLICFIFSSCMHNFDGLSCIGY